MSPPDELDTLSSTWQTALLGRDPNAPVLSVPPIAAGLQAKIDAAAAAYDRVVTPFAQDPSLVVDGVKMPLTDAYLAAHCPDLASSGVGDASTLSRTASPLRFDAGSRARSLLPVNGSSLRRATSTRWSTLPQP